MFEVFLPNELRMSSPVERIFAASGVTAMAGGGWAVWYFNPSTAGFFPVCPVLKLTGFACPGCGMTRGFHALFHGDVLTALDFNAMLPVFAVFFGYLFVSLILVVATGRRMTMAGLKPFVIWVCFVLLIAFGVVRNLPFYPFSILYP